MSKPDESHAYAESLAERFLDQAKGKNRAELKDLLTKQFIGAMIWEKQRIDKLKQGYKK